MLARDEQVINLLHEGNYAFVIVSIANRLITGLQGALAPRRALEDR